MAKPRAGDKKITDSRFKSANYDPRFRNPKLGKSKIKLDDRFTKDQVEDSRKNLVSVDKYGRNVKELKYLQKDRFGGDDFDKYFEKEDESDDSEEPEESEDKEDGLELEEKVDELELKKDEVNTKTLDRARGEGVSDEESSSDSDSDSSSSEDEVESEEELIIEEETPDEGDPTSRLALVNMDWDNIKAVDILATLASFCKKGSNSTTRGKNVIGIKSVTIYPSEFGKMKMAKEEVEGPSRDLFKEEKAKNKKYDISDSDSEDLDDIDLKSKYNYEGNQQRAIKALYKDNQDDGNEEDYNSKSLRKYQLQRLRYYYAIIVCDSVSSAESIYQNCDGLEFEATANFFDLRYVPDDTEFPEYDPAEINSEIHDYCDSIPVNYKPKIDYQTTALQHSKVKLTWDETPSDRMQFATKAFSSKDIEEMDFKAYLASDSDEEEEEKQESEENSVKQKYKSLLSRSIKIGDKNLFDTKSDDSDADMEITFTPGLSNNPDDNESGAHEVEESSIDRYKRKAKERRKQRKESLKDSKKSNNSKNRDSSNGKAEAAVDKDLKKIVESRKENDDEQHFDLKQIMKREKESKKKRKNKDKKIDDEYLQEDFKPDLQDDRFKELFENNAFNIDPNMPEFKKTSTMMKILEERNKRLEDQGGNESQSKKVKKKRKHDDESSNSGNSSAKKLADKIKNKYKKKKNSKN